MEEIKESDIAYFSIYPPVGIARVGNSPSYFIGPEIPGFFETPKGGFKVNGKIQRQAARFRVYAFDNSEKLLGEVNADNGYEIEWRVEVANKKPAWYTFMGRTQPGAFTPGNTTLRNPTIQPDLDPEKRDRLIITPGPQKVKKGVQPEVVKLVGKFHGTNPKPVDVYLGELRTDEAGRLVFVPGNGLSRSVVDPNDPYPLIMTDFDSSDWVDDTCDGTITAMVSKTGTKLAQQTKYRTAVVSGPPKFSTGIHAPTTLYDVMENIYADYRRKKDGTHYDIGPITFYRDIWPLIQRPCLLSWVNGQANGGHGPAGRGNFFKQEWIDSLSDPKHPDGYKYRTIVLGRMRLPDIDKYKDARNGQAYPYFMPWLSGDGGRTTSGDITTFAAVTQLQYERLQKWADGSFTTGTPPAKTATITPDGLTKANLELTIGAPLYPGIELSWNAEEESTYDFNSSTIRINQKVSPGDLSKYLSLPWQSDFYMCRSYWWPSARPDQVVSEADWKKAASEDPKALTTRVPWERGLHQNYTDKFENQPLFANTDMAENWHKLGVVVEKPSKGPGPIFVEIDRQEIRPVLTGHAVVKPKLLRITKNKLELPLPDTDKAGESPIQTVESLRTHLQTAMAVELSSIPLYLFAMYSIQAPDASVRDPRYFDPIVDVFRGIVAEEMLHLSLAGNILKAIGGTPKVYDRDIVPTYPMEMPGRIPKLEIQLRAATKINMQTFIDFELPSSDDAPAQPGPYNTLGQFYKAIKEGLAFLDGKYKKEHKDLFDKNSIPYQFAPGLGYVPRVRDAGGSILVDDLTTAEAAIKIIVDQGEGAQEGQFDDPSDEEKAHYYLFRELKYDASKTWDTYNVRENPHTVDYQESNLQVYHVSRAFDAAYCYLLLTIEKLWTIQLNDDRKKLVLGNMFGLMMGVLAPLAKFLVQQPITGGTQQENAAPCFDFYDFSSIPGSTPFQLVKKEFKDAIQSYVVVTAETTDQVSVNDFGPQLDVLLRIWNTVQGLLDLDTFQKGEIHLGLKGVKGVHSRGDKGFAKGF